ncbi:hypothetical protein VTN49DRAFT_2905 [Thermomyces lanuginosus]|uniref:uncharacterized protein n=1 Tax=Thermomyces lanuginosus TaxID=5541 RepID=UPI0037429E7A
MPSIACIGIVAKNDNPLHIALFPPFTEARLKFSFLINSCLDIFDLRRKHTSVDQDLGLLQALDERLAVYGWLTNTGVKLLIFVDLAGGKQLPSGGAGDARTTAVTGIKDSDLKPAFRALQSAYIRLLQNPFYNPDDHTAAAKVTSTRPSVGITDRKFINEVNRIGTSWAPGVTHL